MYSYTVTVCDQSDVLLTEIAVSHFWTHIHYLLLISGTLYGGQNAHKHTHTVTLFQNLVNSLHIQHFKALNCALDMKAVLKGRQFNC